MLVYQRVLLVAKPIKTPFLNQSDHDLRVIALN